MSNETLLTLSPADLEALRVIIREEINAHNEMTDQRLNRIEAKLGIIQEDVSELRVDLILAQQNIFALKQDSMYHTSRINRLELNNVTTH